MANPYEENKKPNSMNKNTVSNIGGEVSSPTPVTDAMNMESLRKPLEAFNNKGPLEMYGGGMVKKYARGGGTRQVRR